MIFAVLNNLFQENMAVVGHEFLFGNNFLCINLIYKFKILNEKVLSSKHVEILTVPNSGACGNFSLYQSALARSRLRFGCFILLTCLERHPVSQILELWDAWCKVLFKSDRYGSARSYSLTVASRPILSDAFHTYLKIT